MSDTNLLWRERGNALTLHLNHSKKPLLSVEPNATYPAVYRVHWPDGAISDMANLSRAKDAAFVIAMRGPPAKDGSRLYWQKASIGEAQGRPVVRSNGQATKA
jgi:hypothetical protein